MMSPPVLSNPPPTRTKLLVIALITVTVLPILIFATDLTNWRVTQSLRERALERSGVTINAQSPDVRSERRRVSRANIHPTALSAVMSITIHLGTLILFAVAGRRLFALRL